MVRIINYTERVTENGESFFTLELQGGIEIIKSKTGNFYATAKKASIPSTFNLDTCKALIDEELEGNIKKIDCEPYNYKIPETGEEIILTHKYIFLPPGEKEETTKATSVKVENIFSKNGILEPTI